MAARHRPGGPLLRQVTYRVGQALNGTFGTVDPEKVAAALAELPENLRPLFLSMRRRDQRHAIGVLSRLGPAPEVLRQAALLHDVGKAEAFLGTPGRSLVVVAATTGTTPWLPKLPLVGGRLARYMRHPQIGARMLRAAGASPDLVEIVAEHQDQDPRHPETRRLQVVDSGE
ncbi:MAG: hypothetical protein NVSMB17_12530 [Candidatus Dormibacteria bacterium]